jgi:peroxiredoxin Q/BCP
MLKAGDPAPELTLVDHAGRPFRLSELRGRKHAVLFFYPKDNTLVCTREACAFRDRFEEFVALGAVVVGISDDDAGSHMRFATKWDLPYPLLSDPGGRARKRFGVQDLFGLVRGRRTFVIDRDGVVRHVVEDRFNAQAHVDGALAALEAQRKV